MTLKLYAARHVDLDRLARLHARCFPLDAWDAVALASILAMPGANGHFAEDQEGRACGLIFDLVVADEAEILTLCVEPVARRRGTARALLADLFTRALAAGAVRVTLEVAADNASALSLYESSGFACVGRRPAYYRRAGTGAADAWLLQRKLADDAPTRAGTS